MLKKIIFLLIILICLIGAGVYLFLKNASHLTKSIVLEVSSAALGTPVSIQNFDISFSKGTATLKGISVKNPADFSDKDAIFFKEITAEIDFKNHAIKRIFTDGATFHMEQKGQNSNLSVLFQNAETFTEQILSSMTENEKSQLNSSLRLGIHLILIQNTVLSFEMEKNTPPDTHLIKEIKFEHLQGTLQEITSQILNQFLSKKLFPDHLSHLSKHINQSNTSHLTDTQSTPQAIVSK